MNAITSAIAWAFPSLEQADPMILGPAFALILSFGITGVFGLLMAVHDFVRDRKPY